MNKRVLYINSVCGFGSTGRIVADLARIEDFDTLVCYGRKKNSTDVNAYKFTNAIDNATSAFKTIFFDSSLDTCNIATQRLIKKIYEFHPDIIHLHNLHGYYVNIERLFKFLREYNKPVVWTLHDCWPITGYCPFFDYTECRRYKEECKECPQGITYPYSLFKQNVKEEYYKKKELFNSLSKLTIVCPSYWLDSIVRNSFLSDVPRVVINNGIDLSEFKPTKDKTFNFSVLAVANYWTKEKGKDELNRIIPLLDKDIQVTVVGAGSRAIRGCFPIRRTDSKSQLADLYSKSHILLSPTLQDNFPTVNIEALACGTPVITYKTGGGPEILDTRSGVVIERHNIGEMAETINKMKKNYRFILDECVNRSKLFSKEVMQENYRRLYESLLAK